MRSNDNNVGPFRDFTVEPTIETLSDDRGPAGTEVEVRGTGFGDREDIIIYFDGEEVDVVSDVVSSTEGTWTGRFIVPPASQGSHDITAGGDFTDEDDVTAATFEVTPGITHLAHQGHSGLAIHR